MIRPHEIDTKTVHDLAAQARYEEHVDKYLSTNDFRNYPEVYVPDPAGVTPVDRAVVLAKYAESYLLPVEMTRDRLEQLGDAGAGPGWDVTIQHSGATFRRPVCK